MKKETVLVLGAGGIIGQHLVVSRPDWANAIFTRRNASDGPWTSFDADKDDVFDFLEAHRPDVIVNLAGENRVDVVEADPDKYLAANVRLPQQLAAWASPRDDCYLIQCSSQGIFSGDNPTYAPNDTPHPLTHYGKQKVLSEAAALSIPNSEVTRFTFALGIRPFQAIGRRNPLEDMIEKSSQLQVNDKFFSPMFARDCAEILWQRVASRKNAKDRIVHLGTPVRCSRFSIASDVQRLLRGQVELDIQAVSHEYFTGIAPRPQDTTWNADNCLYLSSYEDGLANCIADWRKRNNTGVASIQA